MKDNHICGPESMCDAECMEAAYDSPNPYQLTALHAKGPQMSKVQEAVLHALFSPSASPRWIPCPGSMTFPENQGGGSSSTYADAGTARHTLSAHCLRGKANAAAYEGHSQGVLNGVDYIVDEEFANDAQYYIDDVRNRAVG